MSLNKQNIIHSHNKILVELTYLVFLHRYPEDSIVVPQTRAITDSGFESFLSEVKQSEEFRLKNGFATPAEPPVDLSGLTPHARRIYADLEKAIGNKKKEFRP